MHRLELLLPYAPVIALWFAVLAIGSLVLREMGWVRIKKYPLTIALLVVALGGLPAAGVLKVGRPYQKRVEALIFRPKSPDIAPTGCSFYPANNIWNRRIDDLPLDPGSRNYVVAIGLDAPLHPDFGPVSGIPYILTSGSQPPSHVTFGDGDGESDHGVYRIPDNTPIEDGTDAHALVLNTSECLLYELYFSRHLGPGQWLAGSGAIFDLRANGLRPSSWTSADAAGLPILPGLVRYEEVAAGRIAHAIRFTARQTRRAFVWPARHYASRSTDPKLPPMGQRFRLRASFELAPYSQEARVILTALKEYGIILADNGGNWFMSGSPDSRWPQKSLTRELHTLHGSDFEAVDVSSLMLDPNSSAARQ